VLDLPVDLGEMRAIGRGRLDRFELTGGGFHDRVAKAFRASVLDDPARVRLIDATCDPAAVAAAIWDEVEPLLV